MLKLCSRAFVANRDRPAFYRPPHGHSRHDKTGGERRRRECSRTRVESAVSQAGPPLATPMLSRGLRGAGRGGAAAWRGRMQSGRRGGARTRQDIIIIKWRGRGGRTSRLAPRHRDVLRCTYAVRTLYVRCTPHATRRDRRDPDRAVPRTLPQHSHSTASRGWNGTAEQRQQGAASNAYPAHSTVTGVTVRPGSSRLVPA